MLDIVKGFNPDEATKLAVHLCLPDSDIIQLRSTSTSPDLFAYNIIKKWYERDTYNNDESRILADALYKAGHPESAQMVDPTFCPNIQGKVVIIILLNQSRDFCVFVLPGDVENDAVRHKEEGEKRGALLNYICIAR